MLLGQEMHLIKSFEDSWKNPHGWETIQLLEVWQEIHTLKNHTEEKPFGCSKCDKKFKRLDTLENHERIHTEEKPFCCSKCDKKFTQAGTSKIHERIHIDKKPFSCPMCDKTFRESATLKVHERIHTTEKPFCCSKCNKKFARAGTLKSHGRIHIDKKPSAAQYVTRFLKKISNIEGTWKNPYWWETFQLFKV